MLSKKVFNFIKTKIPKISQTELIALTSGNTSIDRSILLGKVKLPEKIHYKNNSFLVLALFKLTSIFDPI